MKSAETLTKSKSNVWKYYLATFLGGLAFFYNTIDTLYYRHFELSFEQIGFLIAASAAVRLILELPSGAIADLYGKKKSLILASVLLCVALGVIATGSTFTAFLIGFMLWGAAGAFRSGAESAMLYDSLQHIGLENTYRRHTGRAKALSLSIDILSAGVAPLLFALNVRLPYIISAIACVLLALISFSFYERALASTKEKGLFLRNAKQIKHSFIQILRHRLLLWLVLFNTVLFTVGGIFSEIIASPLLIEVRKYSLADFAIALVIATLIQTAVAFFADRIARVVGIKGGFLLIALGFPLALVALLISPSVVTTGLLWGAIFALWSFGEIVIGNDLARTSSDTQRATVFSVSSFVVSGITIAAVPLAGLLVTNTSLVTALIVIAGVFAVIAVVLTLLHPSSRNVEVGKA